MTKQEHQLKPLPFLDQYSYKRSPSTPHNQTLLPEENKNYSEFFLSWCIEKVKS